MIFLMFSCKIKIFKYFLVGEHVEPLVVFEHSTGNFLYSFLFNHVVK